MAFQRQFLFEELQEAVESPSEDIIGMQYFTHQTLQEI